MTQRFENDRVVVIGGANGMGRACVRRLLLEGAVVAVVDRDVEAAADLEGVVFQEADVTDETVFQGALDAVLEGLGGRLDVLIHIAGASRGGLLADQAAEDWDWHYRVNLRSHVISCKWASRVMAQRGTGGAIVTMSSISGLRGDPGWAGYNATKAAIKSFTESLAWEVGRDGVRVNAVCPGPVMSERMMTSIADHGDMPARYRKATALDRMVDPDEAAAAILFLASKDASAITGHALVVDCGLTARTGQPISGMDFG